MEGLLEEGRGGGENYTPIGYGSIVKTLQNATV
jgi:hypothetical protein